MYTVRPFCLEADGMAKGSFYQDLFLYTVRPLFLEADDRAQGYIYECLFAYTVRPFCHELMRWQKGLYLSRFVLYIQFDPFAFKLTICVLKLTPSYTYIKKTS